MIKKYACCAYIRHVAAVGSIADLFMEKLDQRLPNERAFREVGIDV